MRMMLWGATSSPSECVVSIDSRALVHDPKYLYEREHLNFFISRHGDERLRPRFVCFLCPVHRQQLFFGVGRWDSQKTLQTKKAQKIVEILEIIAAVVEVLSWMCRLASFPKDGSFLIRCFFWIKNFTIKFCSSFHLHVVCICEQHFIVVIVIIRQRKQKTANLNSKWYKHLSKVVSKEFWAFWSSSKRTTAQQKKK